jgi:hypothetical protein
MWPSGPPAAVPARFRRARRCSRLGKGGATLGEFLGVDLHRIWGGRLCRRAGSTAAASGRRCAPGSSEADAWSRQGAAGLAPAEATGGYWLACTTPTASGTGASAGTANGDRSRARGGGGAHPRRDGRHSFYGRRPCLHDVPARTAVPRGGGRQTPVGAPGGGRQWTAGSDAARSGTGVGFEVPRCAICWEGARRPGKAWAPREGAARPGSRGGRMRRAREREGAARRRVPASPVAVYPGSTAIISKILN